VVAAAQGVPARSTARAHNQVAVNARTRFSVCGSLTGAFAARGARRAACLTLTARRT
jgi:hypothetical protein